MKSLRGSVRALQALVLGLVLGLALAACNLDESGEPEGAAAAAPAASEVPNEAARSQVLASAGMTIDVTADNSPLKGLKVQIPADAALDDSEIQVGYEDAAPGAFSPDALAAGAKMVSRTLVLKAANGGPSTFTRPVTITLPYDTTVAAGLPPAVLYWDEAATRYRTVSVITVDRAKATVTFRTSHFSKFVAAVALTLNNLLPTVDTQFRVGADSILHPNFGSYQYGGHCAAYASMSTYYFGLAKTKKLYAFAQEDALEQPADDEITRTALTVTYALISSKWASVAGSIVVPAATDTGLLMLASMLITGQPLHLVMHSGGSDGGHSVTAYGFDAAHKRFRIYDSNFPKDDITFPWDLANGFGAYSRAGSYPAGMFANIGYASDDTFGAPAQFAKIVADWEGGKLKDFYANLAVTDNKGVAQTLGYGKLVTTQIKYDDNQTVTGNFVRPAGSSKPVYLHVFRDGLKDAAVAPLIDSNGVFTLSFPKKLEQKSELLLLVSEHPRDVGNGFSGFGKFTVQAEGKNFFVNFGFESGDMTGWTSKTTLLNNGANFLPTKALVTNVGFDPIATDLPTAVFGLHAIRVNDSTPNYHTTFISQRATVPSTGNPQLRFQWAAVLEDPRHSPSDQPYVDVVVRNLSKNTELYRKRFFTSDPTFLGWKDYLGGSWKAIPWQAVVLGGLSAVAGDEIELRIDGADCGLGAHGGYVYFDGEE